jgi:CDP-paratose 2-epimerase
MRAQRIVITGGAGFIGSNLAHRLLAQGHRVTVFDNLSRPGSDRNLGWLQETEQAAALSVVAGDLADAAAVRHASEGAQRVYHLGGQVAVTSSVADPRADFESNALGTLNVLEAARQVGDDPIVLYASTNKVYGSLDDVGVREEPTRFAFADLPHGVAETQPLDFHSPYACSKGAGDQYVRDYARIYGVRTVVARQSCIYGCRQMGHEDQGWIAWLARAALAGDPITIYGSGKQVRDVLFLDDLLDAYDAIVDHIDVAAGQIYNLGGGAAHTLSIWAEFGLLLERLLGRPIPVRHAAARAGDQKVYVSDIRKAARELGWQPRVGVAEGIERLVESIRDRRGQ